MASPLAWLSYLKAAQLKTIAAAVGINSSGTKPVLIAALNLRLPEAVFGLDNGGITRPRPIAEEKARGKVPPTCNILSIDMGIRNLAYCRILPPSLADGVNDSKPVVTQWRRVNISTTGGISLKESDPVDEAAPTKEAFEPNLYAVHAYNLISSLLEAEPPTHILIERQRFRSMGGSAVQEWTLRVNMFESMLYAVLETLKREGRWLGNVHGVSPARVVKHWILEAASAEPDVDPAPIGVPKQKKWQHRAAEAKERKGKSNSAKTKAFKTRLVGDWLERKQMVVLQGSAAIKGQGFVNKMYGRSKEVQIGKLDDLADCLLQGMAWLKWEENRRLIWQKGETALSKLDIC